MSLIDNRDYKILPDLDSYDGVVMTYSQDICVVCGDRASGRHYGAISCEGCKGFFKRSIRKQLGYTCRGTKTCEVTKHHRNRCQYCRLQKCLQMGMHSDSVQHERKPVKEQVKPELVSEEDESCNEEINALDVLHMLFKEEKPTMIFGDVDPLPNDAFKFQLQAPGPYMPRSPLNTQYVCEASSRLLFSSVHWARKLPAFKALDDQVANAVVRSAWAELFAIGLVQYDNILGLKHAIEGGAGGRLQGLLEFCVQLQALTRAIVAADLDPMGFAILRALILFSPDRGARFGLSQAFSDLQVAVIEKYNYENTERLLLLLPQLRAINANNMEDLYFNGFLGGVGVDGVIPFILSMGEDEPGD